MAQKWIEGWGGIESWDYNLGKTKSLKNIDISKSSNYNLGKILKNSIDISKSSD